MFGGDCAIPVQGMTPPTKHSLQELTARTLEFAEVTFEVPSFISKDARRCVLPAWRAPGVRLARAIGSKTSALVSILFADESLVQNARQL